MLTEYHEMTAAKFETVVATGDMIKDYKDHFDSLFKSLPLEKKLGDSAMRELRS